MKDRIALVTGGGKGIGREIARRLHAHGARVAILGRDREALADAAKELDALPLVADMTDAAALDRAVAELRERLGPPAILVQNAGISLSAKLEATRDEDLERVMAINVTAPFRLARALIPEMVKRGFGRVVNVASNAGLTGYAYTSAYCASKHALVGLTRALAIELARTKVTVNAVCPGFVDTEMAVRAVHAIAEKTKRSEAEARRALEELSPQKRLVTVGEVAHVVLMLCGDDAGAVNGQAIPIDGGQVTS